MSRPNTFSEISAAIRKRFNIPAANSNTLTAIAAAILEIPASATGGIDDAPNDGKQYGRQSESWTEITGGGATMAQVALLANNYRMSRTVGDTQQYNLTLAQPSGSSAVVVGTYIIDGDITVGVVTAIDTAADPQKITVRTVSARQVAAASVTYETQETDRPLTSTNVEAALDELTERSNATDDSLDTLKNMAISHYQWFDTITIGSATYTDVYVGEDANGDPVAILRTVTSKKNGADFSQDQSFVLKKDISGKMNQFTISPGTMEQLANWGEYPAIYITPQMPQAVLEFANSGNLLSFDIDSVRHYDDGHFQGEFAHIGSEFVFQEGMGWNYTDGFSLAYDDATGAMTRWSPCSADTHFVAELDAATGYIKITPRDPADILRGGWNNGLLYVPSSASQTFDGIDLYNKMVAEKLETDMKLSDLEARILALENP